MAIVTWGFADPTTERLLSFARSIDMEKLMNLATKYKQDILEPLPKMFSKILAESEQNAVPDISITLFGAKRNCDGNNRNS